jgi:flagellar hook-basal body complex protein FliE
MAKKVTVKPSRGERAKKSKEKAKFKMSQGLKDAISDYEEGVKKSKARTDAMKKGEFGKMNYK